MPKWTMNLVGASLCLMLAATSARAQSVTDKGYYRVATPSAFSSFNFQNCNGPLCTGYTTDGGTVDTSDYAVGQEVYVATTNLPNGSTIKFAALGGSGTWTWNYTTGTMGCWTWSIDGSKLCSNGSSDYLNGFVGPLTCDIKLGSYNMQTSMNGSVLFSHSFNFKHNSSGPLGITLPLDASDPQNNPQQIQLVDLAADRNYTANDATCPGSPNPAPSSSPNLTSACFSAGAVASNPITWTAFNMRRAAGSVR